MGEPSIWHGTMEWHVAATALRDRGPQLHWGGFRGGNCFAGQRTAQGQSGTCLQHEPGTACACCDSAIQAGKDGLCRLLVRPLVAATVYKQDFGSGSCRRFRFTRQMMQDCRWCSSLVWKDPLLPQRCWSPFDESSADRSVPPQWPTNTTRRMHVVHSCLLVQRLISAVPAT